MFANIDRSEDTDNSEVFALDITRMTYGGKGLGFHEGKAVFVADTVPGDRAVVKFVKRKKRYAEAVLLQIAKPSNLRQDAPCAWATDCGGCQWQMIEPEQQLSWKRSFVEEALRRIGKITKFPAIEMSHAPDLFHYRNRVQLKGKYQKNGQILVGYFEQGSHRLIPVESCLVAQEPISALIKHLTSAKLAKIPFEFELRCQVQVVAIQGQDGLLVLVESPSSHKNTANSLASVREWIAKLDTPTHIVAHHETDKKFWPYDLQDDLVYWTAAGQFQQVNLSGNHLLRQKIRKLWSKRRAKRVLDLFCGSGNLSLQLAAHEHCQVIGIEVNSLAIETAKHNVVSNGIKNAKYRCANSREVEQLTNMEFDLILLDPPRTGLGEAIAAAVLRCKAPEIIYVSCDPNTLARDLAHFIDAGYQIDELTCFDFFPHSFHIETVAHLVLSRD